VGGNRQKSETRRLEKLSDLASLSRDESLNKGEKKNRKSRKGGTTQSMPRGVLEVRKAVREGDVLTKNGRIKNAQQKGLGSRKNG